jgi:ribonuclease BN (tRNA processing enzyme)
MGPVLSLTSFGQSTVISVAGVPRILADPGAGTFAGVARTFDPASLEQFVLTRLEIDATGDLPAALLHLYSRGRSRSIALAGPNGRPGAAEFVELVSGSDGAWRYLSAFDGFHVAVQESPSATSDLAVYSIPVAPALQELEVSLYAVAVPDGLLPAVAFRIECAGESIVLAGAISHVTRSFLALAVDCDTLVLDGSLDDEAASEIAVASSARTTLRSARTVPGVPE